MNNLIRIICTAETNLAADAQIPSGQDRISTQINPSDSSNTLAAPQNPNQPLEPEQPLTPVQPLTPKQPLAPKQPLTPEQPLAPKQPLTPEQPLTPKQPLTPEQPLTPNSPNEAKLPNEPYTQATRPENATDDETISSEPGGSYLSDYVNDTLASETVSETISPALPANNTADSSARLISAVLFGVVGALLFASILFLWFRKNKKEHSDTKDC